MCVKTIFFHLVLLTYLLLPIGTQAQPQYRFEQLTSEQGFPQSIAYQLAQDGFGNLWATTEEGVVRFNSREAYGYNSATGLPQGFGQNIRAIHIGLGGGIWIGGERGVAVYNPTFDRFDEVSAEQFSPTQVKNILTTANGDLWVAGFNGLWRYASERKAGERIANARGQEVLLLSGDTLLFGADDGLYALDLLTEEWGQTKLKAPVSALTQVPGGYLAGTKNGQLFLLGDQLDSLRLVHEFPGLPIRSVEAQPEGGWYVATDGAGIQLLGEDFTTETGYRNDVDDPHSVSSDGIYDLLTDREGILWVATYGGGVNKLDPYGNAFRHLTHIPNTKQSLAHPFTRAILEEGGRVWFGTKKGISIWSRNTGRWEHLLTSTGRTNQIVTALAERDDKIWATTFQGKLLRIDKQTLRVEEQPFANEEGARKGRVFSVETDASDNLWVGGVNMDLYRIDAAGEATSFPVQQVKVIAPVPNGDVYVGSGDGLKVIRKAAAAGAASSGNGSPNISRIKAVEEHRSATGYTALNAIVPLADGGILLGTNGAGLLWYDPGTETITTLNAKNRLPSDIVQSIVTDNDGFHWVGTARGLVRIATIDTDTSIRVYTRADGLLSTEFNPGSATRLADGTMIFGGLEGVSLFQPDEVKSPRESPRVVLEEFYLLSERQVPGSEVLPGHINTLKELRLAYNENALTFHFTGVTHAAAGKVRYRWQLEGLNDRWSEPSELNQINFTNLEPGNYHFRVQASTRPGGWGEARELAIRITPPWWRSWWAYLLYLTLLFVAGYVLFRISRALIRRRNAERQIDFFNNITHELKTPLAILLASLEDATEATDKAGAETNKKVRSTVKRLNSLFEQLLNFHKASSTGKSRHVAAFAPGYRAGELTGRFTPLLKERELTLTVDDQYAPPRFHYDKDIFDKIIFNLVSNAVKYSRPNGSIKVTLGAMDNGRLELQVADTGIGIPEDQQKYILREYYRARNVINSQLPGTGLGLMMVKSMVEKEGGSIRFTSRENVGTTFTVVMNDRASDYKEVVSLSGELPPEERLVTEEEASGLKTAHILVVEDNDELREQLSKRLARHFKVTTAVNGKEGLEKASEIFPDLIITDLIMPEMDGMELSRAVQADIQLNHIPIYLMTVLHNSAQKVESIAAGITEYLEKPVSFDLLLAKITNTLSWRQRMRQRYANQDEADRADQHRTDRESEFIGQLETFMLDNMAKDSLSVQDLCQHIGMSRTSLYMKMKNLIDLSPQDFIIHTRLKEARRMLTETDEPVKSIAYDCGFSNPKYFSTSFKKKHGMSPMAFRKSLV